MTAPATLLAIVDDAADAERAAGSGAQRVAIDLGAGWSDAELDAVSGLHALSGVPLSLLYRDSAGLAIDPAAIARAVARAGADEVRIPVGACRHLPRAVMEAVRVIGVVPFHPPPATGLVHDAAAWGCHGLMLADTGGDAVRIIDAVPMPALASLVSACRAARLSVAISGALEPPDVPRLLALLPDELGFEGALRDGGHPDAPVAPTRVRALRALMTQPGQGAREAPQPASPAEPDRIFVRDWVLSISIGAYARERDAPQRVRLSVEAEIARQSAKVADLRDVVSYDLITDAIQRIVAKHIDLVETLAESIAEAVLANRRVATVTVTVEKLDLGPGAVGCRITRRRGA